MRITLRGGERLYINGAVLRADRKVSLKLLNDAAFLLEQHVMQPEEATTLIRQLYFITQLMLIGPNDAERLMALFEADMIAATRQYHGEEQICAGLSLAEEHAREKRYFEALKCLRAMFADEDRIAAASAEAAKGSAPAPAPASVPEKKTADDVSATEGKTNGRNRLNERTDTDHGFAELNVG